MIIPMDKLREYDIYKRYISPAWSADFIANSPTYDVRGIAGDIMLCLVYSPDKDEYRWQFVKVGKNFTGYVDRVRLIARAMSGKNLPEPGVKRRFTPAQEAVLERLYIKAKKNLIKVSLKDAL